ncbi:MAG TPA: molybdopterin molybdotransferase MoeA [Thermoplasmata archaeon]|nr:molybdopterin molybdotransferase MoeA [Thermoplasmata archaeon]
MKMRPFGQLLPVETAVARLLRATHPVRGVEHLPLELAAGRVAARVHRARTNVPPFARATWDGYALRSRDTRGAAPESPRGLRIVGEVFAERALERALGPNETAAIATGAALPRGADAVIIFEEAPVRGDWLTVRRYVRLGERIAHPGDDFPRGATLVRPGETLTPARLGALAASGLTSTTVFRRPRVAIIPNGNELVEPGRRLRGEQIYESNNFVLSSFLRAAGAEPEPNPPVIDDPARIERAIRRSLARNDVVVLTGGSSVGERDFLPQIFPRVGRLLFHGIAVRPGKPTLAASVGDRLLLGLPGHPTSCLSNCFWMLLPVLRKLGHCSGPGTVRTTVRLAEGYEIERGHLATVVPFRVADGRAWPTFKGSSAITSLSSANAYALLPPGHGSLRRGSALDVELLPPPIGESPYGPSPLRAATKR